MNVAFEKAFEKSLDKLRDNRLKVAIADSVKNVMQAATIGDIKNIKKLVGHKTAYRIKVGDYRIGVVFQNDTLFFVDFDHRKDIYQCFP